METAKGSRQDTSSTLSFEETQSTPSCSMRHMGSKKTVSTIEKKKYIFLEEVTNARTQKTGRQAFESSIAIHSDGLGHKQIIIAEKLISEGSSIVPASQLHLFTKFPFFSNSLSITVCHNDAAFI